MSCTMIIKCDRCGKEKDNTQMRTVNLVIQDGANNRYISMHDYSNKSVDWCYDCCTALHLKSPINKTDPVPPAPTFEDLIRQIVQEEVENAK